VSPKITGPARRIRVYIGESDRSKGMPLYHAIVLQAKKLGLAGATVYKGVESFGANSLVTKRTGCPVKFRPPRTLYCAGVFLPQYNTQLICEDFVKTIYFA
jgi:hypothetical protein